MTQRAASRAEAERCRSLVGERLGLSFDDTKLGALAEALRRRAEANAVPAERYLERLSAGEGTAAELGLLAQELTVGETYFLRGAEQLRAFVEIALPERSRSRAPARPIRVLSAGCASGEEPYSLAIALKQSRPEMANLVAIMAVDVNPAVLERAKRARYSSWALREMPTDAQARWFKAEGGAFVLDDAIRAAVTFEERNLAGDDARLWQPGTYDIVFCRNVLMYFTAEQARAVVARISRSLAPGGYLFLGHAETLRGLSNDFHLCHTHEAFYYRRKDEASELRAHPALEVRETVAAAAPAAPSLETAATWVETVQHAAQRIHALAAEPRARVSAKPAAASALPDLQVALELMRGERFEQALELLSALPREQRRDADALLLRAALLTHSGALDAAERACRELLELDELSAGAHYLLALCREGRGDRRGALDQDQIAAYLDPGFAMAHLHAGLLARRGGDRESARRELERALPLLQREDASRLLLFGGGFGREALVTLCRTELAACGGRA